MRITITSSVLRTSLVAREFSKTTVCVHLREVESTVETTWKVGDIDVESKLLVEDLEKLILTVAVHEVNTGTNVLPIRVVRHEFESECIAHDADTITTRVIRAVDSTVRGAGLAIGADGGVPGVSGVAVGGAVFVVYPPPVRVEHDLAVTDVGASPGRSATLEGKFWVCFGLVCTDELTQGDDSSEGESEKSSSGKHCREIGAVSVVDSQDFIMLSYTIVWRRICGSRCTGSQVTTIAVGPTAAWENSEYCSARKFDFETNERFSVGHRKVETNFKRQG